MSLASKLQRIPVVLGDARWWPFYVQRRFMRPALRRQLANLASRWRPRSSSQPRSSENTQAHIHQLQTEGITHLGHVFSAQQCEALCAYFMSKDVHDPYRVGQGTFKPDSHRRHPESHIAHHNAEDIIRAPGILALANNPLILDVVERFLGCKPTLAYLAAWWSYPTTVGAQQAERFHRDVDDWRFIKLFVYLTDVGVDNGPHMYVAHSSTSANLTEIRRFSDEEVLASFGVDNVRQLTGQSGQAFLEDTFGIHKGQPVRQGRRLLLQAVYSMYPLPYGPKHPIGHVEDVQASLNQMKLDPWVNRFYLRF